jgi:hypothetical protein
MVLLICVLRFSLCHALADSPSRHTINFLLAPPLGGTPRGYGGGGGVAVSEWYWV